MSAGRTAIVLQARMASRRLPGKALRSLVDRPLLAHCVARLQRADQGPVVLATSIDASDDPIAALAPGWGVAVIRGPRDDVLRRFLLVADRLDVETVVRATGDNPAVDIDAPSRVLRVLRGYGADYVVERELPVGGAVEAVRVDALRRAAALATAAADREHVTTYLKRHPERFNAVTPRAPVRLRRPDVRLTVDTLADLARVRAIMERAGEGHPLIPLARLIAAARVPDLAAEVA